MIFIAIICPGLSFLLRGKIFSALAAIVLQILAILLSLFGLGFVLWAALVIWAIASYNQAQRDRRTRELVRAMRARDGR